MNTFMAMSIRKQDFMLKGRHHGHHGEQPFERARAFNLDPGVYKWSLAKVDGKYAGPAIKTLYWSGSWAGAAFFREALEPVR